MVRRSTQDGNQVSVMLAGLPRNRRGADLRADRRELARLLEGIGLDVVDGPGTDPGDSSGSAGQVPDVIVELPYQADAGDLQAETLGATVVPTGLPMGLEGTSTWIRDVAQATGREARAEPWIRECLDLVVPRLEWVVPHALLHRRVAFDGDGIHARAFESFARELGMTLVQARITDHPDGPSGVPLGELDPRPDLFVGSRPGFIEAMSLGIPCLEEGTFSPGHEGLLGTPRLGFEGVLALVEAMMNRVKYWDYLKARMGLLNRSMPG